MLGIHMRPEWRAMALVLGLVALFACTDRTPEAAARRAGRNRCARALGGETDADHAHDHAHDLRAPGIDVPARTLAGAEADVLNGPAFQPPSLLLFGRLAQRAPAWPDRQEVTTPPGRAPPSSRTNAGTISALAAHI
jgi:hypothetical protein